MTRSAHRTGPFWDAVQGRAPVPPAAASLGLQVLAADDVDGTVELAFEAVDAFSTPTGDVLGGFLAAMLYDTVGPALLATLGPEEFIDTLDLQVTFLRPTRPGRLFGRGRLVRREGEVALLEAELTDPDGQVLATARSVIRVVPAPARSRPPR